MRKIVVNLQEKKRKFIRLKSYEKKVNTHLLLQWNLKIQA